MLDVHAYTVACRAEPLSRDMRPVACMLLSSYMYLWHCICSRRSLKRVHWYCICSRRSLKRVRHMYVLLA
jgi:hypothetical protein